MITSALMKGKKNTTIVVVYNEKGNAVLGVTFPNRVIPFVFAKGGINFPNEIKEAKWIRNRQKK